MSSKNDPQRILIVDDIPANLIMLEAILASTGVEIITATSGEDAIVIAKEHDLSLILMDIVMPDMDGYTAAEILRSNSSTKYVPIIFVTGSESTSENVLKCYESGVVDVLYKPLQADIIRSKVNIFLDLDQQRRLIKKQSQDLKEAFEKLQDYAQHDQLTGLFNRDQIISILTGFMANARRYKRNLALLFLDLDHFKHVNDSLGHEVGDLLLKSVSERIVKSVREGDFVARLGGDEFAVVLSNVDSERSVAQLAQRMLDNLVMPHSLKEHEILVSSSIGIAMYEDSYEDATQMLKAADAAMYQAKKKGRSQFAFFSPELEEQALKRMEIARELNTAIDNDELTIFYQPQIDASSSQLVGFEALMRWRKNDEWINPALFIPIAEETGLIPKMGEWILRSACIQLKDWQKQGLLSDEVKMAVNISARQLQASNFLSILETIIASSKLSPKCLELELTESTVMDDPDRAIKLFEDIHKLGIEISVDDFGTGYSSLNYLRQLPIDRLKIDRSFVKDITLDQNDEAIVKAIINLSHNLGLTVVAEGVETEIQSKFLKQHDCDVLQGYLISHPIPPQETLNFIKKHSKQH